ncbi:hypothetical protein ACOME3_005900 [Neoechinorhynchus agilis]
MNSELLKGGRRYYGRIFGWLPVLLLVGLLIWVLYAYPRHICIDRAENSLAKKIVYIVLFVFLWVLVSESIFQTVKRGPARPPKEYQLSSDQVSIVHQLDDVQRHEDEAVQILRNRADTLDLRTKAPTQCGVRYCAVCCCLKPDRAHHCSSCNQCVLKMDHHCVWLNNCVSFTNYKFFLLVLMYGVVFNSFLWATGLEFAVRYVFNNATDNPTYDVGFVRNLQQVFGSSSVKALNPFVFSSNGDGLKFPLRITTEPNTKKMTSTQTKKKTIQKPRRRQGDKPVTADVMCRIFTINLHKRIHKISFKRRAPRAIKAIRKFAQQAMKTEDVRIDTGLNKVIWATGVKHVPYRLRIRLERRRNEDKESKHKLYTVAFHVPVVSYKGLLTEVAEIE